MTHPFLMAGFVALAVLGVADAHAGEAARATLTVQLRVVDGFVTVEDEAEARLGTLGGAPCESERGAYETELLAHVRQTLKQRGKLLAQMHAAAPDPASEPSAPADRTWERRVTVLAEHDEATNRLWSGSDSWSNTNASMSAWQNRMMADEPTIWTSRYSMGRLYEGITGVSLWANGPLVPRSDLLPREKANGVIVFDVLPPPVRMDGVFRTKGNPGEWNALRAGILSALKPFECRLWFSDRIAARLQHYLAVRDIAVQTYLDDSVQPDDVAGIHVRRGRFPDDAQGASDGVVELASDGVLAAVYLRVDGDEAAAERILYLLLPTSDYERVRARWSRYLCTTTMATMSTGVDAPVIQLPLDGPRLDGETLKISHTFVTQRMLADWIQRLAGSGYAGRLAFGAGAVRTSTDDVERPASTRVPFLLVEAPAAIVATSPGAATSHALRSLPTCSTIRDTAPGGPKSVTSTTAAGAATLSTAPVAVPQSNSPDGDSVARPRNARRDDDVPFRNRLDASIERSAGKTTRFGLAYHRDDPIDGHRFGLTLGQQTEPSGDLSYSKDFVGFPYLQHRLQLFAHAYTRFEPGRAVTPSYPDERRRGFEAGGTVDLWRDAVGTFGQATLGLNHARIALAGPDEQSTTRLTLAELSMLIVRSQERTASNAYYEVTPRAAIGFSQSRTFGSAGVDLNAHRFLSAFTQWDFNLRAATVLGPAPVSELLSFGGEDSVRGYRSDRVAGRRLWAMQNELWIPVPWLPDAGSIAKLRKNLSLAGFFDVGGTGHATTAFAGVKSALGVGIRFNLGSQATLKLDIARPVGSVAKEDRRLRFNLSASTRQRL